MSATVYEASKFITGDRTKSRSRQSAQGAVARLRFKVKCNAEKSSIGDSMALRYKLKKYIDDAMNYLSVLSNL